MQGTWDPAEWLLEAAADLEVPEGFRVEVFDGRIIVTPLRDGHHAVALSRLGEALIAAGVRETGFNVL